MFITDLGNDYLVLRTDDNKFCLKINIWNEAVNFRWKWTINDMRPT